jgi:hydrogenase expression/formation protein HypC
MCLAVPARIVNIEAASATAQVELDGVRKMISTALIAPPPQLGDYVLVHVGYALTVIDPVEAQQTLQLMRSAGLLADSESKTSD